MDYATVLGSELAVLLPAPAIASWYIRCWAIRVHTRKPTSGRQFHANFWRYYFALQVLITFSALWVGLSGILGTAHGGIAQWSDLLAAVWKSTFSITPMLAVLVIGLKIIVGWMGPRLQKRRQARLLEKTTHDTSGSTSRVAVMFKQAKFPVPKEIVQLMDDGFWPRSEEAALGQNLKSLVSREIVQSFAPEEEKLYLSAPPFRSMRTEIDIEGQFRGAHKQGWIKRGALDTIDLDRTILIGDFGLGSDAPIALDYRCSETEPSVIRLRYAKEGNQWVEVAPTVAQFIALLKIRAS